MSSPSHDGGETRPLPSFIRWIRTITAIVFGIGYIVSADSFSGSPALHYVEQLPLTLSAWGYIFILCALLCLVTKVTGYFLTAFVWFTWSLLVLNALLNGHVALWGAWVWPMQMAFVNMYELTIWGRQKFDSMRNGIGG